MTADYMSQHCQCDFYEDRITDEALRCFPDSPKAVTFRATLHGTTDISSSSLIQLIEQWTNREITVILGAVFMTIDSTCALQITSIHERECKPRNIARNTKWNFDIREVTIGIVTSLSTLDVIAIAVVIGLVIGLVCIYYIKKKKK